MQQIAFRITEKKDSTPAASRLDFILKCDSQGGEFGARSFDGIDS